MNKIFLIFYICFFIILDGIAQGSEQLHYRYDPNDKSCVWVTRSDYNGGSKYKGDIVIPETIYRDGQVCRVIGIYQEAFRGCDELTSVFIPKSIKYIESNAFSHCKQLNYIEIPDSVEVIEDNTFYGCKNLYCVKLPKGIKNIGALAFVECGFSEFNFPDSLVFIGEEAFRDCKRLKYVDIPNGVTKIDKKTFYNCNDIERITLPESMKYILNQAFAFSITYTYTNGKTVSLYCNAKTPPNMIDAFTIQQYHNIPVYVPRTSVSAYRTRPDWHNFHKVYPDPNIIIPYKLSYIVDGKKYKEFEVYEGENIIPLEIPSKEGYIFSGWSEIPETMPAHDVTVTGTFKFNPAAAVNPVVEDNSEITEQNAEDITEFKMNLMSGVTFVANDGAKVELWIGGVLKGTAEKKDISEKDGVVTIKFSPVSVNAGARGMLDEFRNTVSTSSTEDVEIQVKVAANSFKINNEDISEELSYSYTAKTSVAEKIENDVTALDEIEAGGVKDIIYNLNGSRVNGNTQKGIIIKNSNKVLVK